MEELTTPKNRTNKIDYTITLISFYKFVCEDENITSTYVGHTSNFTRRKNEHKSRCNCEKSKRHNLKIYQTIRENGGWDNWRMIEIKNQLCESKRHAEQIEQELLDQYKAKLNSQKAFCGETRQEYDKQYKIINKEHYKTKNTQYCEANKEKIAERKKQYYLNNKEKIAEINKQYRLKKKMEKEQFNDNLQHL